MFMPREGHYTLETRLSFSADSFLRVERHSRLTMSFEINAGFFRITEVV